MTANEERLAIAAESEAESRRRLLALAAPVLAELLLSYGVGFFDTYLSGRFGSEATHAVGLAAYVSWLASMMFGLVSTGTTALVSRHWGSGEYETAGRVLNRSLALAFCLSVVFAALVWCAAPMLCSQLGMQSSGFAVAVRYLRFEAIGFLFTGITLAGAAALRGSGDTRTPMFVLGSVSVINVVASLALVFGFGPIPETGVDGIVGGTIIARGCGGLLMFLTLLRGRGALRIIRAELRLRDDLVRRMTRIGIPAVADGLCMWSGQYLFLMIIGRVRGGPAASAAHMVGVRVEELAYLPALALGIASASLIGQSLGRGDPSAARRFGHLAARYGGLLATAGSVAFYFGATAIYSVMHDDAAVREIGVPAFRWMALFQAPLAVAIVYIQSLRGAGETRSPMIVTVIGIYLVRVPLAWWFGVRLDGGLLGAWIGMFADVTLRAALVFARYSLGNWWTTKV